MILSAYFYILIWSVSTVTLGVIFLESRKILWNALNKLEKFYKDHYTLYHSDRGILLNGNAPDIFHNYKNNALDSNDPFKCDCYEIAYQKELYFKFLTWLFKYHLYNFQEIAAISLLWPIAIPGLMLYHLILERAIKKSKEKYKQFISKFDRDILKITNQPIPDSYAIAANKEVENILEQVPLIESGSISLDDEMFKKMIELINNDGAESKIEANNDIHRIPEMHGAQRIDPNHFMSGGNCVNKHIK